MLKIQGRFGNDPRVCLAVCSAGEDGYVRPLIEICISVVLMVPKTADKMAAGDAALCSHCGCLRVGFIACIVCVVMQTNCRRPTLTLPILLPVTKTV